MECRLGSPARRCICRLLFAHCFLHAEGACERGGARPFRCWRRGAVLAELRCGSRPRLALLLARLLLPRRLLVLLSLLLLLLRRLRPCSFELLEPLHLVRGFEFRPRSSVRKFIDEAGVLHGVLALTHLLRQRWWEAVERFCPQHRAECSPCLRCVRHVGSFPRRRHLQRILGILILQDFDRRVGDQDLRALAAPARSVHYLSRSRPQNFSKSEMMTE